MLGCTHHFETKSPMTRPAKTENSRHKPRRRARRSNEVLRRASESTELLGELARAYQRALEACGQLRLFE
jgi:hypothetical protein